MGMELDDLIDKYANTEIEKLKQYKPKNFLELLYAEINELLENEASLKKCGYCGRYFVPFSLNTEYCDRIIKEKKSCKEYAPMYFYRKRKKDDILKDIYAKADSAHYKRHTRTPELYTWEQFSKWREKAIEKLTLAEQGGLTPDEFKNIIKPNIIE